MRAEISKHEEHAPECGKDAKGAARVEAGVIVGVIFAVDKDSGNQETRQHEKQVYANPCVAGYGDQDALRVRPVGLRGGAMP